MRPERSGKRSSRALDLDRALVYPPTRHPATGVTVSNVPDELLYTPEHEYVARTGDPAVVRIGITDYAQGELGDVVFVNLPKRGDALTSHQAFGTIEAVKAVSELYSPAAGTVAEINPALDADPAVVNRDPYGEGWMITLRLSDPTALDGLLSPAAYRSHIGE
jgi:glycine cleavage system H protein